MSPSRISTRGATLIEAMAALVVFSVGILGVMQMNVLASKQNTLARSQTTASKIARDVADSFERLPFEHTLLNVPTGLVQGAPGYDSMDNPDGLVKLEDAAAVIAAERPLMGAADASFTSEGDGTFYQVAWRAWQVNNPDRNGRMDQIRILVMVRFPTIGTDLRQGVMRQVNTWAIKTDSRIITDDDPSTPEF